MNTMVQNFLKPFQSFSRDTAGAIAIAFALMAPIVVGAAGAALDYSYAYLVQQRLHQAIDSAALAGAASSTDSEEIEQKIIDFFNANYPPEKIGVTFTPVVTIVGNQIHVSGYAYYDTFFLAILGITEISVEADTTIQRHVQGLEVALVLDNTGSMSTNNNIGTLKSATRSFINIMFDNALNPEHVRIALVPYSNTVRVGRYGIGKTPEGDTYNDGSTFVTLPSGVNYTTDHSSADWYGCVIEHKAAGYSSSATHASGSKGQLWKNGSSWDGHGWNPGSTSNDPYDYDVLDEYEGPWDIYAYGKVIAQNDKCSNYSGYATSRCSSCNTSGSNKDKCNQGYCFCWKSDSSDGINSGCPYANIVPLSSDRDYLLEQVEEDTSAEPDDMEPHGNTLGNIGMVWGGRVISPEPPFEEAHSWDNDNWQKAVVMMTDGDNTEDGTYSSFWFAAKNNMSVTKFNQRFEETCEDLKEKGVLIYTVTFSSGINSTTKGYYERCASSEDQYFDAPTQEELIRVFEQISRELSNLHISG
ncbi:MAG: pilus assembly protein [Alphaproteobacteria bacterium]|nr:pilus assembly protein [Alphaproteobacteria bacterium]